jgi:tRNA A37 threonylcarbamoyltransferase TsaD
MCHHRQQHQLGTARALDLQVKADIAASFQSVAVTHLTEKTRRGVTWARELAPELRHLVVAGGVACNRTVRSSLQQLSGGDSFVAGGEE